MNRTLLIAGLALGFAAVCVRLVHDLWENNGPFGFHVPAPAVRQPEPGSFPPYAYGGAPTEERLQALERQVAAQERWIKENTQSPNWSVPMSVADDEAYGPEGRAAVRRVLAGP